MPSRDEYEQLPNAEPEDPEYEAAATAAREARSPQYDRFNPPPPAPWKRAALIFFIIALFIIAWRMRIGPQEPIIIHADR
jgi:hypothetical protein